MSYSEAVRDHYENPRNVGTLPKDDVDVASALVGAPACGDVIRLQLRIAAGVVTDARFKTFGCGTAIACASHATEWAKGKSVDEVDGMTDAEVLAMQDKLGSLPAGGALSNNDLILILLIVILIIAL